VGHWNLIPIYGVVKIATSVVLPNPMAN